MRPRKRKTLTALQFQPGSNVLKHLVLRDFSMDICTAEESIEHFGQYFRVYLIFDQILSLIWQF